MDGASIHCDANLVNYLRSLGIIIIFLPAYCPFFNPIEVVFGLVKRRMQRRYSENTAQNLTVTISSVLQEFKNYDLKKIFAHCGYSASGFNAGKAFGKGLEEMDFI